MLNRTPESLMDSFNPFVPPESGGAEPVARRIPNILGVMRRRWRLILVGLIFGLVAAVAYIVLATPLYSAEADVIIDTQVNQELQHQNIVGDAVLDPNLVDSEVAVISSESVVVPVIRSMGLASDPEFVGPPDTLGLQILWNIRLGISAARVALGVPEAQLVDQNTLNERTAVAVLLKRLIVKRVDLTNVISITYASESPEKSAKIANAIAEQFRSQELAAKFEASKIAGKWLEDRLSQMKSQVSDADSAVQKYKAANEIVDTGPRLLNQEQLSNLNGQLITARTATAEARAKLDRIQKLTQQGMPSATVTDALNNPVISRLRSQFFRLVGEEQDLSARLGHNHEAVVRLRDQMGEIRASIVDEEKRIAAAYESDFAIAQAGEKTLSDSMARLVGEAGANSEAQVHMRDLESSADTFRSLYDSFLQKYQQTTQEQNIPVTDVRIVTVAATPLLKSSPKVALGLAGGLLLGLLVGAGAGLTKEMTAEVFQSPSEVEAYTGLQGLGTLPMVKSKHKPRGMFSNRSKSVEVARRAATEIGEFVCDSPRSRFAETFRNIKVSLDNARISADVRVIGVVSSVPGEGKTVVAANLGATLASVGLRTLVVDGDFHQRSLSRLLAPDAKEGLNEALEHPDQISTYVRKIARTGLNILPCHRDGRVGNPADLLGSPEMALLLRTAKELYDYIVVDLPPIVPVVDAKAASRLVDSFIYVVEWGLTKRSLVLEALSDSEIIRQRTLGIVLNRADPRILRSLEAYKGKKFDHYYVD